MAQLHRYRLIRTLASGGMAHVYEATATGDRGFERRVAIKRVLPQFAHEEQMRRMFLDEARICSNLHHGNIVGVVDYGHVDGAEFIVMEYVDGIDAERAVTRAQKRNHPMPAAVALHIVAEVAHALDYSHHCRDAQGSPLSIVHRDVSPHNILLSWEGQVKLTDFGIALSSQREHRTRTGIVKGKLAYMAPEQATGKRVGPEADIYALGATLHALLVGEPPESRVISDELPTEVAEIVRSCLAKPPGDRPSAEQVALTAGTLASRSSHRDARGALREWLSPLRHSSSPTNALDDLMGLALVPAGGGRRFTVSRTDRPSPNGSEPISGEVVQPPLEEKPADGPVETGGSIHLPVAGVRRVWMWGAVLFAAAAVAIGVWTWDGVSTRAVAGQNDEPSEVTSAPTRPSATKGDDAPARTDMNSRTALAIDPTRGEPKISDSDSTPVAPTATHASDRSSRNSRARLGRRTPRVRRKRGGSNGRNAVSAMAAPPEPPAPQTTNGVGWLRIPRGSTEQERVEVDGHSRGFTPAVLRLTAGAHQVTIRDARTNDLIVRRHVELGPHHTRIAPYRLAR